MSLTTTEYRLTLGYIHLTLGILLQLLVMHKQDF